MKQTLLWADGNFAARRTVLVNPSSNPSPRTVRGTSPCKARQRELWPRLADYRFAAFRTAVVDVRQMRSYERFVRFLRDELWLDMYVRRGQYRLEYVSFLHGEPQYRVYCRAVALCVMDTDPARLGRVQRAVAAYAMAAYGFQPGQTYLTRIDPLARKYPREGSWREKWAS